MMRTILLTEMELSNLGCEAILRSTITILRSALAEPLRFVLPSFAPRRDRRRLADLADIQWVPIRWMRTQLQRVVRKAGLPCALLPFRHSFSVARSDVAGVLSLGGDMYTLTRTYLPMEYVKLQRQCDRKGIPFVLWGATLESFTPRPHRLSILLDHLRRCRLITARDQRSVEYLAGHGVSENVRRVYDPAFVMEPIAWDIEPFLPARRPELCVGVNLSRYSQRFHPQVDLKTETIRGIEQFIDRTGQGVVLVCHVFHPDPAVNDAPFHREVFAGVSAKYRPLVSLADQDVGSPRMKYLISQLDAYAGTRMHSTIAAFSSCVPTLSLPYSKKGMALTEDIYGNTEWALPIASFSADLLARKLARLVEQRDQLRRDLQQRMPQIRELSIAGGRYFSEVLCS